MTDGNVEQDVGGLASFFESLRADTVGLSTTHTETAAQLKTTVLPILERLHKEIKDRTKHVQSECDKGAKAVSKARNSTQAHLELLGQHASAFDSASGVSPSSHTAGLHVHTTSTARPKPDFDPFLLKKGVIYRLHKQITDENAQQADLLGVQTHFKQFEEHILQTIQQGLLTFDQTMAMQSEKEKSLYADILSKSVALPADFEWSSFTSRYSHVLVSPHTPKRELAKITFPNESHPSTTPLIEGALQRKGKIMRSYNSAYYVITPTKYLHEFKDPDNKTYAKEYEPEMSLYLPECTIGALKEGKFTVQGKDAGSALKGLSSKHEFAFKAGSAAEGARWHEVIGRCAGLRTGESPLDTPVSPPAYERHDSQESGVSGVSVVGVGRTPPVSASPVSAAGKP